MFTGNQHFFPVKIYT